MKITNNEKYKKRKNMFVSFDKLRTNGEKKIHDKKRRIINPVCGEPVEPYRTPE